jgi:hypothetical protein
VTRVRERVQQEPGYAAVAGRRAVRG